MKLKFKSIVFIIIGIILLFPVFIYGAKAFVNFTAVLANLSKELSFIIDIVKFCYKEFFYSTTIMKYVSKLFIGVVGFRFFIGLFFNVYKFGSTHMESSDKKQIRDYKESWRSYAKNKGRLPMNVKSPFVNWGGQQR